jgi:hypothetical protein
VEIIIISSNIICSRHHIAEKIGNLALNNNYSLTSFINLKPNYGTEIGNNYEYVLLENIKFLFFPV